jgi:polyisoprenoid-binding protein YceI
MKKVFLALPIALLSLAVSCGSAETEEHVEAVVAENVVSKDYTVSTEESSVLWSAEGVGHGHNGSINIASGSVSMENDVLTAGEIVIDMPSLLVLDIEDSVKNAGLYGHLTTGDFFNVAVFPKAKLVITDAADMSNVKGNMTIKEVTEEITFSLSTAEVEGGLELSTTLNIDRTKFGVTYNSGNFFEDLGDHLINDEFTLEIKLMAK